MLEDVIRILSNKIDQLQRKRDFEKRCNNQPNAETFNYFLKELREIRLLIAREIKQREA
ncbi:MAG: hypothetical protein MI740_10320 [Halanaerobiales bacterium]|nr:hypothetical protein [Halanaerobiales bacterium]